MDAALETPPLNIVERVFQSEMVIANKVEAAGPNEKLWQNLSLAVDPTLKLVEKNLPAAVVSSSHITLGPEGIKTSFANRDMVASALSGHGMPPVMMTPETDSVVSQEKPAGNVTVNLVLPCTPIITASSALTEDAFNYLEAAGRLASPEALFALNNHLRFREANLNVYVLSRGSQGATLYRLDQKDGIVTIWSLHNSDREMFVGQAKTLAQAYAALLSGRAGFGHTPNVAELAEEAYVCRLANTFKKQPGLNLNFFCYDRSTESQIWYLRTRQVASWAIELSKDGVYKFIPISSSNKPESPSEKPRAAAEGKPDERWFELFS